MRYGVQTLLTEAGESGCYALCIIELSERILKKPIDLIKTLETAFQKKFIHYNDHDPQDDNNFFVKEPAALMSFLTGQKWQCSFGGPDRTLKPGEYLIERWERKVTGKTIGHFRLPDWDPLMNSQTVKLGQIVSTRIFTPLP